MPKEHLFLMSRVDDFYSTIYCINLTLNIVETHKERVCVKHTGTFFQSNVDTCQNKWIFPSHLLHLSTVLHVRAYVNSYDLSPKPVYRYWYWYIFVLTRNEKWQTSIFFSCFTVPFFVLECYAYVCFSNRYLFSEK